MRINSERLLDNLNKLKTFTDTPGEGVTRFSYSAKDAEARAYIIDRAEKAGASIHIDALQNIRMGLKTNRPGHKTLVAGSHIDTVRNGGWLDGIYGVCSALEVLETLSENDFSGEYNFEAVVFAEEEGSNFGSTMTGSKFIAGIYNEENLDKLTRDDGLSLRQVLCSLTDSRVYSIPGPGGINAEDIESLPWDFSQIKAMVELHIEQGPILDKSGERLGIIDSIFGMRVIEVVMEGVGNHAGATPMSQRQDALSAAAEAILKAEEIVRSDEDRRTVVTVGKMEIAPNCSNVIPEKVCFSLEVRDKDEAKINRFMDRIIAAIRDIAKARKVSCSCREHSHSLPLHLDDRLAQGMKNAAEKSGIPFRYMDSGAVHDACMIAYKVPTGMIFVPSINGRSHVPEEDTKPEDLVAGAEFLFEIVCRELG